MADSGADRFVKKMSFTGGNLAAAWKLFQSQLKIYMVAKKFSELGEEEKIANALVLMGSESVPIYEQFTFSDTVEGQKKTLDNVLKMFEKHCEPVKNVIYERVKFNSMRQGDMTIHQFITAIQSQADVCEYGDMRNDLARDRIVVGVNDQKLREYLIDVEDLTIEKCIQKAKQFVSHHDHARKMEQSTGDNLDSTEANSGKYEELDQVDRQRNRNFGQRNRQPGYRGGKNRGAQSYTSGTNIQFRQRNQQNCDFCNKENHIRDRCPARFSICHFCKSKGHWAKSKACFRSKQSVNKAEEVDFGSDEVEGLYLGTESD